jgi:hypothetical protein
MIVWALLGRTSEKANNSLSDVCQQKKAEMDTLEQSMPETSRLWDRRGRLYADELYG